MPDSEPNDNNSDNLRTIDQLLGDRGVELPDERLPPEDTVDASQLGTQSLDATELHQGAAVSEGAADAVGGLDQPRYTTGKIIGQGGMGIVVDAKDVNIRRRVAMKVMLSPSSATRQQLIRFIEEAQVTGQLEHPGIAPVHELALDAHGSPYYTMKLVKGRTLDAILSRLASEPADAIAQYPLSRLLNIFLKICETIAFAHSRGVIHRDLKPANIMVGEFGEVLVMDWGLAKVLGSSDGDDNRPDSKAAIESIRSDDESGFATLDGQVLGSPRYMAPEQARGAVKEMDQRTDVYALGAILYQILTLHPPVSGDTIADIMGKVESGEILEPRERLRFSAVASPSVFAHLPAQRVPEALAAVAMKALSKERSRRYASATALHDEVESWQLGFATDAESASAWRQTLLFVRRNRTVAIATACVFAALMVGLVTTLLQRNAAIASQELAETNEGRAEDEAAKAKTAQAAAEASARSEERAKREALVTLSSSFNNLGFVEADQGKYAEAQLWFAKAAEMTADDELKAVYTMRARAFGREGIQPLQMFYGRPPRTESKVSTEHQLAMDPSNRYLRYRLLFHGAPDDTQDPLQDEYVLLDLNEEREVEFAGQEKLGAVDFAPQGKEMAVAFAGGIVRLLQVADLSVSHELRVDSEGPITLLQYSDDGRRLFIGSNPARVLDVTHRKLLEGDMPLPTPARRAAFTADNQIICSTHVLNGISYNQFTQTYLFPLGVADAQPLEKGMREAVAATKLDADENRKIVVPNSQAVIDRFQLDLQLPGQAGAQD